jgi:TrwC relaxase
VRHIASFHICPVSPASPASLHSSPKAERSSAKDPRLIAQSAAGGVQEYQQAEGLVMVPFRHSTSRENEPQLHTHLAVLNRVVSRVDGKVRALDGRGFAPVKQAAEAVYERALARGIGEATGAVMELRPDGVSRRVVGVDEGLCRAGSSRRGDVEAQIEAWTIEYRETHGREPSPAVCKEMAQAAVFKTRPAKQGPGGPEGFRPWVEPHAEALVEVPGRVADAAAGRVAARVAGVAADGRVDWPAAIRAGVADVQRELATWQFGELFNKVDRHLPADLAVPAGIDRAGFVHAKLAEVLADGTGFGVVALGPGDAVTPPAELAGPDGRSPYRPHLHWDRYATTGQLAAEGSIVAATRAGGVTLADARRQAHAADGQRAARESAALERGTQQQTTAAAAAEDTDRTRRDTTLTEPAQAQRTRQADATAVTQQQEAPRMVRTPGPQQ